MHELIVGPWVWDTSEDGEPFWRKPEGFSHALDIRSDTYKGSQGILHGLGVFIRDHDFVLGSDYENYGDINGNLSVSKRNMLASQIGVSHILSNTPADAIEEAITLRAAPEGDTFAAPILPGGDGIVRLRLGPISRQIDPRRRPDIQKNIKETYRQAVTRQISAGADIVNMRKYGGALQRKLGLVGHEELGYSEDQTPIEPTTSLTETFSGSGVGILGDLTWTVLSGSWSTSSGVARAASAGGDLGRCDSDLSSDDHKCTITIGSTSSPQIGAVTRKDSTATDSFYYHNWTDTSGSSEIRVYSRVTGSFTLLLDTEAGATPTLASGDTITGESNGSIIKMSYYDTSLGKTHELATTDTTASLIGNLRCGMRTYGSSNSMTISDWTASDTIGVERILVHPGMTGGFNA